MVAILSRERWVNSYFPGQNSHHTCPRSQINAGLANRLFSSASFPGGTLISVCYVVPLTGIEAADFSWCYAGAKLLAGKRTKVFCFLRYSMFLQHSYRYLWNILRDHKHVKNAYQRWDLTKSTWFIIMYYIYGRNNSDNLGTVVLMVAIINMLSDVNNALYTLFYSGV